MFSRHFSISIQFGQSHFRFTYPFIECDYISNGKNKVPFVSIDVWQLYHLNVFDKLMF